MKFEIVTTTFNSESTIGDFLLALNRELDRMSVTKPVRLTIVDDGSEDSTLSVLANFDKTLLTQITLHIFELSRNFGHHKALIRGIQNVSEDTEYVLVMDSDGEESPQYISSLIKKAELEKLDIVLTVNEKRKARFISSALGKTSDLLLNLAYRGKYHKNICTMRLLSRKVIEALKTFREADPVFINLHNWVGFNSGKIVIQKSYKGSSAYTLRKRLKLFFNLLIFNSKVLTYFGIFLGFLGVLMTITTSFFLLIYRISNPNPLNGYTSIGMFLSLFAGLVFLLFAIILVLLERILKEVMGRPRTIDKNEFIY